MRDSGNPSMITSTNKLIEELTRTTNAGNLQWYSNTYHCCQYVEYEAFFNLPVIARLRADFYPYPICNREWPQHCAFSVIHIATNTIFATSTTAMLLNLYQAIYKTGNIKETIDRYRGLLHNLLREIEGIPNA